MSQQVPFDNSGVPQGDNMMAASVGYGSMSAPGTYASQGGPSLNPDPYGGGGGGGSWQPPQEYQPYARNKAPMIDPIESARLTPQILVLLVLSGLKRHWKWSLPLGLILGLLAAGTLYLAFPLQYEARASIQIRTTKQQFLYDIPQTSGRDDFMNTQLALLRSSIIIDLALTDPDVAKLPCIVKQKDRRSWIARQLRVRPDGRSEIVLVSIATESEDASKKIVNAIVENYLTFIADANKRSDQEKIRALQVEQRRHITLAERLQGDIRAETSKTARMGAVTSSEGGLGAGFAHGESLLRDVSVAEAQLVYLQARLTAIQERISQPNSIPREVLIQMNPKFATLSLEHEELVREREGLMQTYGRSDHPRVGTVNSKIKQIEDRIAQIISADGSGMQDVLNRLRLEEKWNEWTLKQDIRAQEILVNELRDKYNEQLVNNANRSVGATSVAFNQVQLARVDKTLDTIETRINAIQTEQRAPGQITLLSPAVSLMPSLARQLVVVGTGAAMFAFFPLLLSIAIERMKPRLYHVSQVRRAIPQVLIGEIMEPPVSWIHGTTFRKRLARYRESVHNWCTHLLLSDPFRSCRTLAVASVAGDDGKTFLAVQIAVAMAQMKEGNVLLIDGDMRVGRLHLLFGNEETGIGLADVLSFRNRLGEAVVQNEKEPNLHLLSAGQLDISPYELLGDGRFREMLDSLEWSPSNPSGYSLIIVVLPPVANAAESLIMASSTDSTLLCVRQGETVLAAMEDVYRKLVNTGASVDGIVVKDIPYYQMAGRDGGFADKLEQIRLSHLLQYAD